MQGAEYTKPALARAGLNQKAKAVLARLDSARAWSEVEFMS